MMASAQEHPQEHTRISQVPTNLTSLMRTCTDEQEFSRWSPRSSSTWCKLMPAFY